MVTSDYKNMVSLLTSSTAVITLLSQQLHAVFSLVQLSCNRTKSITANYWQCPSGTHLSTAADYVFGNHKFGGNAQAITNKRWLHHTSFLWDYDQRNMLALKNPSKQPKYREVSTLTADAAPVR